MTESWTLVLIIGLAVLFLGGRLAIGICLPETHWLNRWGNASNGAARSGGSSGGSTSGSSDGGFFECGGGDGGDGGGD